MSEKYPIIAVEVDSEQDHGFTVAFPTPMMLNQLPITERAHTLAVEDAYNWYPTWDSMQELEDNQRIGWLVVNEDGGYIDTLFDPEEKV